MNSLPETFKEVKSAMKYGRDDVTVDKVINSLRLRDLELKQEKGESEALFVTRNRTTMESKLRLENKILNPKVVAILKEEADNIVNLRIMVNRLIKVILSVTTAIRQTISSGTALS